VKCRPWQQPGGRVAEDREVGYPSRRGGDAAGGGGPEEVEDEGERHGEAEREGLGHGGVERWEGEEEDAGSGTRRHFAVLFMERNGGRAAAAVWALRLARRPSPGFGGARTGVAIWIRLESCSQAWIRRFTTL
jgi:hypothetical protein